MVITISILGSGGTVPTVTRNLPATAIQCDGKLFLFDCGEGTQTQIVKAKLSIGKLEGIYISHMHGDHVMGLPGLLMTLGQVPRDRPLQIRGPNGLADFIECNRQEAGRIYSTSMFVGGISFAFGGITMLLEESSLNGLEQERKSKNYPALSFRHQQGRSDIQWIFRF